MNRAERRKPFFTGAPDTDSPKMSVYFPFSQFILIDWLMSFEECVMNSFRGSKTKSNLAKETEVGTRHMSNVENMSCHV